MKLIYYWYMKTHAFELLMFFALFNWPIILETAAVWTGYPKVFWRSINPGGANFLQARCPSCHPSFNVSAPKE